MSSVHAERMFAPISSISRFSHMSLIIFLKLGDIDLVMVVAFVLWPGEGRNIF